MGSLREGLALIFGDSLVTDTRFSLFGKARSLPGHVGDPTNDWALEGPLAGEVGPGLHTSEVVASTVCLG